MAENAVGPTTKLIIDKKSCTVSISGPDGAITDLAVQIGKTESWLDKLHQQIDELYKARLDLATPQTVANRFAALYGPAAQFAQEQTDAAAGQGAQQNDTQQKGDETGKKYNEVMSAASRSLSERVRSSFGNGVESLLGGWRDGVLSVVTGKQQIGPAFQKLFVSMRNQLRDFFVKSIAEQAGTGLLDILGLKTKFPESGKTAAKASDAGNAQAEKNEAASSSDALANGSGTTGDGSSGTVTAGSGFFNTIIDTIGSFFKPGSLLGSLWSGISSLFKPDGLLGGLMSGISSLFSSLFSQDGLLGGILSGITSFISMIFHTGGIVGETARPGRMVSAGLFAGAPRFHTGGLVAGEVPIIARKGEAVFTPEQMTNADRLIQTAQDGGRAVTQSVTVNVAGGSTGDREQDKALAERIGASVKEQLRAMMGNELRQQMRPGGMLNNMSYGG